MSRHKLALFGAFGGALPTVVRLFQLVSQPDVLRPAFSGLLSTDAIVVSLTYLASAAVLAAIFPYPLKASAWLATTVGAAMPTLVGGMSTAAAKLAPIQYAWRGDAPADTYTLHGFFALLSLF